MNREYKFRGFDIVSGKGWVYGDLVHNLKITKEKDLPRTMVGGYEVAKESVGLCTGYPSCDGSLIYEGDLVKINKRNASFVASVIWDDIFSAFILNYKTGTSLLSSYMPFEVCIIGTSYENPNFLNYE